MDTSTPLGGCITFIAELVIVGAIAEAIYSVNHNAGLLFVALVIMGYMATGSHLENVTTFFKSIQTGTVSDTTRPGGSGIGRT